MINFGIIGMGQLGYKHAKIMTLLPNVRLAGVSDTDEANLKSAAEKFAVPGYISAEKICAVKDLDAVSICTPDYAHRKPLLEAFDKGKFVYMEKPLADNLEDAEDILHASVTHHNRLMVGHLLRFESRYAKAKELVRKGVIGEIVHIYGKRNSYVSGPLRYAERYTLLYHMVVHEIDLVLWITGSQVTRVYAENESKVLRHLGMQDSVFTIMKMGNGAIVSLEHCWILNRNCHSRTLGPEMEIVGTKGSIHIFGVNGMELFQDNREIVSDVSVYAELEDGRITGCLYSALESFIRCIAHGDEFPISALEGYRAVKVVSAIEEALEKHIPIYISD